MEDLTWVNSILWFLAGAVTYKVGTLVLSMSVSLALFNETIYHVLNILKMGDENYHAASELKYEVMKAANCSKEDTDEVKDKDRDIINLWRELSIAMILFACPGKVGQRLGFKNWDQAMRLLKKQEAKNEKILN